MQFGELTRLILLGFTRLVLTWQQIWGWIRTAGSWALCTGLSRRDSAPSVSHSHLEDHHILSWMILQTLAETRDTPWTPARHFHLIVSAKKKKKKDESNCAADTPQKLFWPHPGKSCAELISTAPLEVCVWMCLCMDGGCAPVCSKSYKQARWQAARIPDVTGDDS